MGYNSRSTNLGGQCLWQTLALTLFDIGININHFFNLMVLSTSKSIDLEVVPNAWEDFVFPNGLLFPKGSNFYPQARNSLER